MNFPFAQFQRGFTLIEVIIVISLSSIVVVVASALLVQGFQAYLTSKDLTHADREAYLAVEYMVRDIQMIPSSSYITTANSNQLIYTDNSGNSISYQMNGTTLERNNQPLADGITTFQLGYYNKNGILTSIKSEIKYIDLSIGVKQGDQNFSVSTVSYLRNAA